METHQQGVTASKILDVAGRLFSEKGFSNVSIRDICRETGTTAPAIYYYFGNKKGLFEAVAGSKISMGDFIAKLGKASRSPDPKKGLEAFIAIYLSSFPEHSFDPGLYMRDSASLDKKSARMVSRDLDRIRAMAIGLIESCIGRGAFKETSADLAADCLLGMLNRVIFQHIHFSKGSERGPYGDFVTRFFFRAMS